MDHAMPRRDPDPFQAALIELLRDASVSHPTLAAAADLLAAEHRMSWRFTEREISGKAAKDNSAPAPEEGSLLLWENTAPIYLTCVAALETFAKDGNEAALVETLEEATQLFSQAGVDEEPGQPS